MVKSIGFVNPQSYSNLAKYDAGVLSEMAGADVNYYCSRLLSSDAAILNSAVQVLKLFSYNKSNAFVKSFIYMYNMVKMFITAFSAKHDVMHVQWCKLPLFDIMLYGLLKLISRKPPIFILTVHNVFPHKSNFLNRFSYRLLYRFFDRLIVHEKRAAESLTKQLGVDSRRIAVIKHGIIPFDVHDGELDNSLSMLGSNKSKLVFCSLGSGSNYKGTDLLITAWFDTGLYKEENCILIIAGRMDSKIKALLDHYLSKYNCNNLHCFDRYMSESEMDYISSNSSVCVLPYRVISQSGVLMSVLPYRLPLIVTDVGGLSEPFEYGDIGLLLKEATVAELSEALKFCFLNQSKVTAMKRSSAWNDVLNVYSWENISKKTRDFYC